ncbi:hypothetical protein Tsubulata_030787 [Turnera subulata]|uniref:Uncharacterized protein n=1 Tax=Turnera subulata TaxID=218843 RepID=A0A9Q0FJH4_9ROSI|nr:hypothetical protein Tsubulata_030787 [Turnera subulata]
MSEELGPPRGLKNGGRNGTPEGNGARGDLGGLLQPSLFIPLTTLRLFPMEESRIASTSSLRDDMVLKIGTYPGGVLCFWVDLWSTLGMLA